MKKQTQTSRGNTKKELENVTFLAAGVREAGDVGEKTDSELMEDVVNEIMSRLVGKSQGYDGKKGDKFTNFTTAPSVISGKLTPIQYCWHLMEKHITAMPHLLHPENKDDYILKGARPMLRERVGDILGFAILLLAMEKKGLKICNL